MSTFEFSHAWNGAEGSGLEKNAALTEIFEGLLAYAQSLEAKLAAAPEPIPEAILRAADAIIAYPEAYEGFALLLAQFLRDSWPAIPEAKPEPQPDLEIILRDLCRAVLGPEFTHIPWGPMEVEIRKAAFRINSFNREVTPNPNEKEPRDG